MNPDQMQPTNPQMTPDESAASLAFATRLSEQMMPKMTQGEGQQPTDAPQPSQDAPGQKKTDKKGEGQDPNENDAKFTELEAKMVQMNSDMKDEVSGIKDIIIEALKEDNGQK